MDQTTPYVSGTTAALTLVVPLTIALSIGTGGHYTSEHHEMRAHKLVFSRDGITGPTAAAAASTTAADLTRIKSILKLTVKDLGGSLGVSRQTIYDWMGGAEIKVANAAKLENLKDAADIIASAQLHTSPLLLQRKLPSGQTLLEAISSGRSGRDAATSLVRSLRDETRSRAELAAHFAGRSRIGESSPDDAPLIFDERG
jgi:predicted DNA-binding protein (UPF0251 family)